MPIRPTWTTAACLALALAAACHRGPVRARPALVQPGPPGEPSRTLTPAAARDLSHVQYTAADVRFMQGMIGHHAQAVEMTRLLASRTDRDDMRKLARRIEVSQADEMAMMRRWLEVRHQEVPAAHAHQMAGTGLMPGMLTPLEMERLAAAGGAAFDRLFLEGMIAHHRGALQMVHDLFATPGAAQESEIFAFASDVDADQRMEIARMRAMLEELQR